MPLPAEFWIESYILTFHTLYPRRGIWKESTMSAILALSCPWRRWVHHVIELPDVNRVGVRLDAYIYLRLSTFFHRGPTAFIYRTEYRRTVPRILRRALQPTIAYPWQQTRAISRFTLRYKLVTRLNEFLQALDRTTD